MEKDKHYMNLSYDLSGSISKNRFRNELLWGLKKILDLHKGDKDYTVVFDYCCDIEVHLEDNLEFYQIKTQNNNGNYTVNKLVNIDKTGNSVLGKLYILKYDENKLESDDIVVALVSNAPLSDSEKTYADCECLSMDSINKESIEKIKKAIRQELKLNKDINIVNTFFIRTGMDLMQPDKSLIGELVVFFDDVLKEDVKKVRSLYRILFSQITDKACYEMKIFEYDEILEQKGISRKSFDEILKQYIDKTDVAVEKTKDFINSLYAKSFKKRIDMNKSLNRVFMELINNKVMQQMEKKIIEYIKENIDNLPSEDTEIIENVYKYIINDKPIEMDDNDVETLIMLSLKRLEEGVYEEFNI